VCIVLLSSQFKAAKPGISSYWILMLFQCLNAFIILNCALFFLTINHGTRVRVCVCVCAWSISLSRLY